MLHVYVCEHRADVTCQKAPVSSHLSKGHSPRSPVACQYAFWQIPVSLLYDLLSTNSGVLLGRLWLKQRRMVRSDTDVPCPWSSPLFSLEVVLGSLVTIRIIRLFNLSSIFLLRPHPGRLATVPWPLNFCIICATVVTGISS